MSYPKPLSERSLAKMYAEANIDEKKSDFLHKFFLAAANLYGVVALCDMWVILRYIAKTYEVTDISKNDVFAFASIVRREDVPYYVYEIDELYSTEKRSNNYKQIVNKSIIDVGYDNFRCFYDIRNAQRYKAVYIPSNLLIYENPKPTKEEINLLDFLKKLKVTAKKRKDEFDKKVRCEHYGKCLSDFSYKNSTEESRYNLYFEKAKSSLKFKKALDKLIKDTSCSEAQKIVNTFKKECNMGNCGRTLILRKVFGELRNVGVELNEKQEDTLLKLLTDFNNYSNLWCNRGWTPDRLEDEDFDKGDTRYINLDFADKEFITKEIDTKDLIKKLEKYLKLS